MRVYFTPEVTKIIESQPPRVRNISKLITKYIEDHTWEEVMKHPKFQASATNERDLFTLRFDELRFFVSLNHDKDGEYVIIVGVDQNSIPASSFKLSNRNLPYDYVHARSHIIKAIQEFVQEPIPGLRLVKFSANATPGASKHEHDGETLETGSVTITYHFRREPFGEEVPEITCIIDHGSDWSPTLDVRFQGRRLLLGVYPAWDWAKLIADFKRELTNFHRSLSAGKV